MALPQAVGPRHPDVLRAMTNLAGVLDTGNASGVELRVISSAANNYKVYYEFIDPIGRL